jgi:hypothetical protein
MTDSELHLNIVEVRKPELTRHWWQRASPSSLSAVFRSAVL